MLEGKIKKDIYADDKKIELEGNFICLYISILKNKMKKSCPQRGRLVKKSSEAKYLFLSEGIKKCMS